MKSSARSFREIPMKTTLKLLTTGFFSMLCAIGLSACSDDGDQDQKTNLRFINVVSDLPSVDLLIDFDLFFENVRYSENSGYFEISTDPHILQVTPSNSLTPIDETKTVLDDGTDYTYLAYGSSLSAGALLLRDDNESPGKDAFKVRVSDVAQTSQSLNLYIVEDPRTVSSIAPTAANLRFKSTTQYRAGLSGTYSIVVTNSKTGDVLGTAPAYTFSSEGVYTIILANPRGQSQTTRVNVVVIPDHVK